MDTLDSEGPGHQILSLIQDLAGGVNPTGLVLLRLIRIVANQYEGLSDDHLRDTNLSGPRLGLLMRLMANETTADHAPGTSPTHLSRCQHVSKNTISALLRGLEEQGLIERTLDASDKRVFRIRVSERGRELVLASAPAHIAYLNDLMAALTPDEQEQFRVLLEKLHRSFIERATCTKNM